GPDGFTECKSSLVQLQVLTQLVDGSGRRGAGAEPVDVRQSHIDGVGGRAELPCLTLRLPVDAGAIWIGGEHTGTRQEAAEGQECGENAGGDQAVRTRSRSGAGSHSRSISSVRDGGTAGISSG